MLDIRKIRENPDFYRERLARRNSGDEKYLDQILALDEQRRKCLQENEALKSERNRTSKEIGALKASGIPVRPPMPNSGRKAVAQSIGEVKRIAPPHREMISELKIRIVGTEMMIVVNWKKELTAVPMPVRYI